MEWKRISFVLPLLLYAFASPSRGADAPDPCAAQWKEYINAADADKREASEVYKKCSAIAAEQQKAEFAATRDTWAASLDRLPNGGWIFLTVSPDGTYAIFGSHRHATRQGNVAAVWFRTEYRELHSTRANESYKGVVERNLYDCVRVATKQLSSTYYSENNLGSPGSSFTFDEAKTAWDPVIPGTVGDSLLDWACKTTARATAASPP